MSIVHSEIVNEAKEKITIIEITKEEKPSSYKEGNYTLAKIIDQNGREIVACGKWVENWKEGDDIEGILQEKASVRIKDGQKKESFFSSLYLKNPNSNY